MIARGPESYAGRTTRIFRTQEGTLKKALVVGINGYGFPNDLGSSTRDAEAFADVLETVYRFDHVRMLRDGDATRDGVDRGLEWLCQSANTNDRLAVFFSGHGVRFERNGVIEEALVLGHELRQLGFKQTPPRAA
jgi:hypothetical protein